MAVPLLVALVCENAASRPAAPFAGPPVGSPPYTAREGTLLIQRDTRTVHYWAGGTWLNAATGA